MAWRLWVAVVGVLVVTAYASLMDVQALVLDPLAAVPGRTIGEIHAHLLRSGMNVTGDIASVTASAAVGVVLAVAAAALGIRRRLSPVVMAAIFLALVALGATQTFGNGFELEMDVADAYGVGGGAHTVWTGVLYQASLAALLALILIGAVALATRSATVSRGARPDRTPPRPD